MNNLYIDNDGNKYWRNKLGQLHREDGPAFEDTNDYKEYWINGKHYNSLE